MHWRNSKRDYFVLILLEWFLGSVSILGVMLIKRNNFQNLGLINDFLDKFSNDFTEFELKEAPFASYRYFMS